MAARLALICGVVLTTLIPSAWAADAVESGGPQTMAAAAATVAVSAVSAGVGVPAVCEPTISPKVSVKNRRKFRDAFDFALERVQEDPDCRGLFSELGADGTKALDMIVVLPIGRAQAQGGVCRGISAYTLVGGGPIWLCREFSRLSDKQAAMVIIHEALHHAGLSEYPQDPNGMTSTIINQMVRKNCGR